ncbi:MAG TPA: ferrous iron transport protein A [Gammaproteobacteria bacterium]|nr:ferrous iron transport protein A [Gammaproteobacteria bacterium]
MQFSEIKTGQKARIVGIQAGQPVYRERLISMGLLPGTEFVVTRMAPLGDPVEIFVRGFSLSLRKHEANLLQIEQVVI